MQACWRLRHEYFVRQRGWVTPDSARPGLEVDAYDGHCHHLAVFEGGRPLAYLRVLPWRPHVGFMLEREFAALLPEKYLQVLPREGAVELSRLVCCSGLRAAKDAPHPLELLLKELYHLALEQGIGRFYVVVEEAWLKPFARRFGLAFTPLGPARTMPDGTCTVAAVATLAELQAGILRRWPDKYEWYQPDGVAAPEPQAEAG